MIRALVTHLLLFVFATFPALADINARNGVAITTGSTVNGITPLAAINGLIVVSGYLVNQNFEGAGYDNGETWGEDSTPNEDYTGTVLRGSQSLRVLAGQDSYTDFAAQSDVWFFTEFQFTALPGADAPNIFFAGGASHTTYVKVGAVNGAGAGLSTVQLFSGGSLSSASATALSASVHYYCWLHVVAGGSATLYISTSTTRPSSDGSGNVVITGAADAGTVTRLYIYSSGAGTTTDAAYDHVLGSATAIGNNP